MSVRLPFDWWLALEAQPTVGGTIFRQMGLGYYKQASWVSQRISQKTVFLHDFCYIPVLPSPYNGLCPGSISQINHFFSQDAFGQCFITAKGIYTRTLGSWALVSEVLSSGWFPPGHPTAHSRGHQVSPHLPLFLRACFLLFHPANLCLLFESSTVTFPIRYSVVHRDLVSPVAHQAEMPNGLWWWKPTFRIVQTWVRLGLLTFGYKEHCLQVSVMSPRVDSASIKTFAKPFSFLSPSPQSFKGVMHEPN